MREFLKWPQDADLVSLSLEIGVGVFILVTFVRCALE